MARRALIVVLVLLLVPVVALAACIALAHSEWAEGWVERRAAASLGREVDIEGMSLTPGWPPRLTFARLRIGNPEWAKSPNLIEAEDLYAGVEVPPLFGGRLVIPFAGARKATGGFERDAKRSTWAFGDRDDKEEGEGVSIGLVLVDDGRIKYIDTVQRTDLDIEVKGSVGEGGDLLAEGTGRFRGEPTKVSIRLPELTIRGGGPLAIEGKGTFGRTRANAKGTLATNGRSVDLQLEIEGPSLDELAKVTGMVLPDSPPYRLAGRFVHKGSEWTFDPFEGRVGDSDLSGTVAYKRTGERPFLQADLTSKVLDLDDLGPLIGAPPSSAPGETSTPEQRAETARRRAAKRIIPDQRFAVDAWARMDADVRLKADRVQRPKQVAIDKFSTHLVLKDQVMRLEPLDFGVAQGRVRSNIVLDGRSKPAKGVIKVEVQGLKLAPLFPTVVSMKESLGTLQGHAELSGRGGSVSELLGSSNGSMSLAVDGGRIGALLVELIGLDVAESVMLLGSSHKQVDLRCAVSGFQVKDGVATADSFVIDTVDTLVTVEGTVNLGDESLDFEARPYPKDQSLLALRTPLTVTGPIREPKVRPQGGPLALRAAAAVVLGAVAPPLALLALVETGPGKDAACGELLGKVRKVKSSDAPRRKLPADPRARAS